MQTKKMKLLSVILALMLIVCSVPNIALTSLAEITSGTCGNNLTWEYDTSTYTLTISGTGAMTGYGSSPSNVTWVTTAPWRPYYNTMKTVVINSGVTSIGSYAFSGCTGFTSITIPDSVTSIGRYAFYDTPWFNSQPDGLVYAGKVAYTIKGACPSSVTIREGIVGIADFAFWGCTGLTSITIPDSVTSIVDWAFSGCTGLTSITIPDSVTSIGNNAFANCSGLTSVTIPDSVTSIGSYAFRGCTGLTSITITASITSIGERVFSNCTGLTSITIPDSITSIGHYAFYYCIRLTSVTIPNGVTSIGNDAFHDCWGLTSITIPDSVTSIGQSAFSGCTGLTSITIGNGVTSISNLTFEFCFKLTNIIIPDSVTSIGQSAFSGCTRLKSITIQDSVTNIGNSAFSDCTSLNTVYYSGTQEQKNQIYVGSNNAELTNAEWIYNCTAERAEKCETLRTAYMKTAIQKKSGAKPTDSSYNLRLISMLDGLKDYSEVGFYITIAGYNDGENDEPIKYSTDTVYTSLLNGGTRVKASDYGAECFTIVNMTVPNEYYSANIRIKPYIVFTDGSEFSGNEINTTVSKYIK